MSAAEEKSGSTAKRRGPRKEADIRAEVEAELRASMEAEIRAQVQAEAEAKAAAEQRERELAGEARPISGMEIDGDPTKPGSITVHFVDDGLTVLGKVWLRGEELTINPDTPQWAEAYDVLTLDEYEQERRWGKRLHRPGPWRGLRLDQIDDPDLTEAEREQLKKAEQIRQERYGALLN